MKAPVRAHQSPFPAWKAPSPASLRDAAAEAALAAGHALAKRFGKKLEVRKKRGAGIVTDADMEAEREAFRVLRRLQPHFGILTEESPAVAGSSEGRWILDPLDGTTNFVHGFPMFCVSIAAEWQGRIVAGAIYSPILKDMYLAALGLGATINGRKLSVSGTRKIADSLLTTGFTYRKKNWLHREMGAFEKLSREARAVRRPGSAALDLAYTARGVFDGFWERRLAPWDVAAGALLVQEAGGKVTDFKGKPFSIESSELIASNGALHDHLLRAL